MVGDQSVADGFISGPVSVCAQGRGTAGSNLLILSDALYVGRSLAAADLLILDDVEKGVGVGANALSCRSSYRDKVVGHVLSRETLVDDDAGWDDWDVEVSMGNIASEF